MAFQWKAITGLASAILAPVTDYFKAKQERKRIKVEGEARIAEAKVNATVKRLEDNDAYDANLESLSLQDRGWKDDYLLLITTMPLVLVFFPEMVPKITAGFIALDELPEWYMWVVLMVYIDTFGFRRVLRVYLEKRFGGST